jgi:hypothetical protein
MVSGFLLGIAGSLRGKGSSNPFIGTGGLVEVYGLGVLR